MNWFESAKKLLAKWKAQQIASSVKFTPRAQQVCALARKEAERLNHNFIGTEHILLGLIKLGDAIATNVLKNLGLNLENVRIEVERRFGNQADQKITGYIPYTPRTKKVIALAVREAKALNNTYVGTEHLLLGLLSEGGGMAAQVFKHFNVDARKTRNEILKEITPIFPSDDAPEKQS